MLVQRLNFRPCLTHWKNSAMRTTLVVRVQPCPFILRLLSFTLLIGLVNNEHGIECDTNLKQFSRSVYNCPMHIVLLFCTNHLKQVMMERVQSSSREYTLKGRLCGYRMLQVLPIYNMNIEYVCGILILPNHTFH